MEYILGTSDAELDRLAVQHEIWREVTTPFLDRLEIAPGARVLDAGSGPGFVSLELAERVGPRGKVVALDASPRWERHLSEIVRMRGLRQLEVRQGELESAALEEASYDLVFSRWVLSFVRDPRAIVARLARALRPGGRLAIEDYNHEGVSLFPPSRGFVAAVRAGREWYTRSGGDVWIAGRLPGDLRAAGLTLTDVKANVLAGGPGSPAFRWADAFFPVYAPRWAEQGLMNEADLSLFQAEWEERKRDPEALFFSPIVVDLAARKP
jgi:SAM-dependent methyltransferase